MKTMLKSKSKKLAALLLGAVFFFVTVAALPAPASAQYRYEGSDTEEDIAMLQEIIRRLTILRDRLLLQAGNSSAAESEVGDVAGEGGGPGISELKASSEASSAPEGTAEAVLSWDTDVPTWSKVYFGSSSPLETGNAGESTALFVSDEMTTSHQLNLFNLLRGETYYFIVVATDSEGRAATSSEASFTTP